MCLIIPVLNTSKYSIVDFSFYRPKRFLNFRESLTGFDPTAIVTNLIKSDIIKNIDVHKENEEVQIQKAEKRQ